VYGQGFKQHKRLQMTGRLSVQTHFGGYSGGSTSIRSIHPSLSTSTRLRSTLFHVVIQKHITRVAASRFKSSARKRKEHLPCSWAALQMDNSSHFNLFIPENQLFHSLEDHVACMLKNVVTLLPMVGLPIGPPWIQ
jgi:hypothetical protein